VGAALRVDVLSDLHPMADLLARCPGMTKEHVYYLEQQGYLQPVKQRHGKIQRNLYTTAQLELVAAIWRHRQAGIPPREAYRRALREQARGQLSMWPEGDAEGET
jgi:DNA-binding transcriptional MerR regulator